MAVHIRYLDDAHRAEWDHFVREECADATFFHLSGWKAVIEQAYGLSCPYAYAERDGRIVGVLPLVHCTSPVFGNRLISTGFTIGGGPAALDDDAYQVLDAELLRQAEESRVKVVEIRRPARPHLSPDWKQKSGIYANFSRSIAPTEDECLKQIPRKQRAVVRKAIDAGLVTDQAETTPENFFPLYAFSMRNMGTPVFGDKFFRVLMREFSGHCDCVTTFHQGIAASSVLNFYFRNAVMPYYTGCRPVAREIGANDYMYWRVMRRAVNRDFVVFDFGRSKYGTGPFSFKKNWGFDPTPIVHEYFLPGGGEVPEINPLNPKFRLFISIWRRLPLSVANLLGPWVVRGIG